MTPFPARKAAIFSEIVRLLAEANSLSDEIRSEEHTSELQSH